MSTNYTCKKDEARVKLRDKIMVCGAVPRASIRPMTPAHQYIHDLIHCSRPQ